MSTSTQTSSKLETLFYDVFGVILAQILSEPTRDTIKNLSCTSRRLRQACLSVLFHNCIVTSYTTYRRQLPPDHVRPYIRHVIYSQTYWPPGWEDDFGIELPYLPNIHSVTFHSAECGVPWRIIATCLAIPQLTSISFQGDAVWATTEPFSPEEVAQVPNRLTALSYAPTTWRESSNVLARRDLTAEYALETVCLRDLVLGMTATAESLTLPFETSPLSQISESYWPRLHTLTLYGRVSDGNQSTKLSSLVRGMPSLRRLSFKVATEAGSNHGLEKHPCGISHSTPRLNLTSLTIAYPDPDDLIFSQVGGKLERLSLCDWPRYYYKLYCPGDMPWDTPLLSPSSCLKILKRMDLTSLRDLELVYRADGDEVELLFYLSSAMPALAHLELHRYRQDGDTSVPYKRIAHILTGIRSLHTLHLNLNLNETCGPYCDNAHLRDSWRRKLETMGCDILRIMRANPELAFVALLHHREVNTHWVEFYPDWHVRGMHADWDEDGLRVDSESLPYVSFFCL